MSLCTWWVFSLALLFWHQQSNFSRAESSCLCLFFFLRTFSAALAAKRKSLRGRVQTGKIQNSGHASEIHSMKWNLNTLSQVFGQFCCITSMLSTLRQKKEHEPQQWNHLLHCAGSPCCQNIEADPWGAASCRVEPSWVSLVPSCMFDQNQIWGILRSGQCNELFVSFHGTFLSRFWVRQSTFFSLGIHMNERTDSYCNQSIKVIYFTCERFNVVAEQCNILKTFCMDGHSAICANMLFFCKTFNN